MTDFISKSIKLSKNSKRFGYIATTNIPSNSIILIENAKVDLIGDNRYYEMYQILYKILSEPDSKIYSKFMNLLPDKYDKYIIDELCDDIYMLPEKMQEFFMNIEPEKLNLYCTKYIRNAFGSENPLLLIHGAMFNHSCNPNVTFIQDKNRMYFVTVKEIRKGEELMCHYGDITEPKEKRQKRLLNQYGFICNCDRCCNKCVKIQNILDIKYSNPNKYNIFT
jgi:hypothetical protein